APRTAPAARRAKIGHGRVAEAAAIAVAGLGPAGRRNLLVHGLEELAERVLRRGNRCFNATLCRAPLTQMELMHGIVFDGRQVDDGIPLPAAVTQHLMVQPREHPYRSTDRPRAATCGPHAAPARDYGSQ